MHLKPRISIHLQPIYLQYLLFKNQPTQTQTNKICKFGSKILQTLDIIQIMDVSKIDRTILKSIIQEILKEDINLFKDIIKEVLIENQILEQKNKKEKLIDANFDK